MLVRPILGDDERFNKSIIKQLEALVKKAWSLSLRMRQSRSVHSVIEIASVTHLDKIMVVAQVLSVQPQTTNVVYMLNDGTAGYEARQWVDPNSEEDSGKREIR